MIVKDAIIYYVDYIVWYKVASLQHVFVLRRRILIGSLLIVNQINQAEIETSSVLRSINSNSH